LFSSTTFVAAVRTVFPNACVDTLDYLNVGQPPSLAVLAGRLSNDLEALSAPLVLVLDDFHRIRDSSQTHALLDRLLAHPSDGLHLVVITRHDPQLVARSAARSRGDERGAHGRPAVQ
jgi:LuxR family maltose regulon positive regulatory protein